MQKKLTILLLLTACAIFSSHAQYKVSINPNVGGNESRWVNDTLIYTTAQAIDEIGYLNLADAKDTKAETTDYEFKLRINDIIDTSDSKTNYLSCRIVMSLSIVDLSRDIVTASTAIYKTGTGDNFHEAMANGIDDLKKPIKKFILDKLPYYGKILEVTESKGNEAKMLYISIGSKVGITKGQKLAVKAAALAAGRPYYRSLGVVKVEEVEGEFGSRCKVTEGGDKIYETYLEDPDHIAVMTIK